mmetsp:Transcript_21049/g.59787  ORF Transcript_21049/g.59787 Transcript_21049/m.59787 type:complete len:251 (+) Transcript_21049:348-1100(+)
MGGTRGHRGAHGSSCNFRMVPSSNSGSSSAAPKSHSEMSLCESLHVSASKSGSLTSSSLTPPSSAESSAIGPQGSRDGVSPPSSLSQQDPESALDRTLLLPSSSSSVVRLSLVPALVGSEPTEHVTRASWSHIDSGAPPGAAPSPWQPGQPPTCERRPREPNAGPLAGAPAERAARSPTVEEPCSRRLATDEVGLLWSALWVRGSRSPSRPPRLPLLPEQMSATSGGRWAASSRGAAAKLAIIIVSHTRA